MLKNFFRIVLSSVLAVVVLSGCGKEVGNKTVIDKPDGNQVVLRLAEIHPEDYPTTICDKEFAKLVEERTNGRVKVLVYPDAQLGQEKAVIEQVQFGAIDFARISVAPVAEFAKELNVLQLPYLYRDGEHMWKVLDGPIGERLLKAVEKSSLVGLAWFDAGSRNFYTKKEIKTPSDLKGLKIRVPQSKLMMSMVTALGASPIQTDAGEVYSSLQTGVIDGAENNYSTYVSDSHVEVAKYFLLDGHTRIPEIVVASKNAMNKLSKEDQEIVRKAAKDTVIIQKEAWAKKEKEAEEIAKALGAKITVLEVNTLLEFQNAVKSVYYNIDKEYKDIIKEIQDTK